MEPVEEHMEETVEERLDRTTASRRVVERHGPSLGTSLDGRTFTFHAAAELPPTGGSYVTIETAQGAVLALVLDVRLDRGSAGSIGAGSAAAPDTDGVGGSTPVRFCVGEGVVLESCNGFHEAPLRRAEPAEIEAHFASVKGKGSSLAIGSLASASDVVAQLDAAGFGRHTFLCGQSGSGKTYSLGVLLEQILLRTSLPLVILDPNSDYVRLGETRNGVESEHVSAWEAIADRIVVRSAAREGHARLRLRVSELTSGTQAAMLRLDPVTDREEYAAYVDVVDRVRSADASFRLADLVRGDDPEMRALALRVGNLGVESWGLWARDRPGPTVLEELDGRAFRALCVDLGAIPTAEERAVAAAAVLERLWERRAERRPVLVVIDEAHNVCPQRPDDPVTARATELAIRIAAEGRKYGIFLLISTQRPQKVHEQVLSQCDNLVCMRMNSLIDAAGIADTLSFAPASLLSRTPSFQQGEALVAGSVVPHPLLVRFGQRLTEEGGSDVPSDWANPA